MTAFDYLVWQEPQRETALFLVAYAALSLLIGRTLRRPAAEGLAIGFLVLAAASNLAVFVCRGSGAPIALFGPLTLVFVAAIAVTLGPLLPPRGARLRPDFFFILCVLPPLCALWIVNIVQPDPASGLTSHHGWFPLYLRDSFAEGHFLRVSELRFGDGYLSSIFYNVDLMGMIALAGTFGADRLYPAFLAAGILASMAAFLVLAQALRGNAYALVLFCLVTLVFLRLDGFYRLVVGSNWGDKIQYVAGATMLFYFASTAHLRTGALAAAAASTFLVFARPYGWPESALLIGIVFLASWFLDQDRRWRLWLLTVGLLAVFSIREFYCLAFPPSPFYPGSRLLETARTAMAHWDTLNDFGVLTDGRFLDGPRSIRLAWLAALAALAGVWFLQNRLSIRRVVMVSAPLLLFVLPFALQLATGYRTNAYYSKPFIVALFVPSWYLCRLAAAVAPSRIVLPSTTFIRTALAGLGLAVALSIGWQTASWFRTHPFFGSRADAYFAGVFASYRGNNADYAIAEALRATLGDRLADIAARPIVYFHYEPGLGLRNFIGGRFVRDWDFASHDVDALAAQSGSLAELVAKLGYPNLYLSYGNQTYTQYFPAAFGKFGQDLARLRDEPWIERIVTVDVSPQPARFVITRPEAR